MPAGGSIEVLEHWEAVHTHHQAKIAQPGSIDDHLCHCGARSVKPLLRVGGVAADTGITGRDLRHPADPGPQTHGLVGHVRADAVPPGSGIGNIMDAIA